jgi:hypothetical protein
MRECLRRGIVTLEEVYALADTVPQPPPPKLVGGHSARRARGTALS